MEGLAGTIMKEIRQKNNHTAVELYGDQLSKNSRYRFENGLGEISIEVFIKIFYRLDYLDWDFEKLYRKREWKSYFSKEAFYLDDLTKYIYLKTSPLLLKELQDGFYLRYEKEKNKHDLFGAKVLSLSLEQELSKKAEIALNLLQELLQYPRWYREEVFFYSFLIPYLPLKDLENSLPELKNRFKFVAQNAPNMHLAIGYQYLRAYQRFALEGALQSFLNTLPLLFKYNCLEREILPKVSQTVLAPYEKLREGTLSVEGCQTETLTLLNQVKEAKLLTKSYPILATIVEKVNKLCEISFPKKA